MAENLEAHYDAATFFQPSWRTVDEWYSRVISHITASGVEIPKNCRLMQQKNLLMNVMSDLRLSGQFSDRMLDISIAFSDIHQIVSIVMAIKSLGEDLMVNQKWSQVLQDAMHIDAMSNSRPTPGRDTQFELFAWASIGSEYKPTLLTPPGPDISAEVSNSIVHIEAKRAKSVRAVEARVRDAVNQLSQSGIPSVIAVDISLPLSGLLIKSTKPEEAGDDLQSRMSRFLERTEFRVGAKLRQADILSLSAYASCMYMVRGNLMGPFTNWAHLTICEDGRERFVDQIFLKPNERLSRWTRWGAVNSSALS